MRKVRKSNIKNVVLKENEEKKDIKKDMMCVTWPLNICLVILHIRTCEDYTIDL